MILVYILSILAIAYGIVSYVKTRAERNNGDDPVPFPRAKNALVLGVTAFIAVMILDQFLLTLDGQEIAVIETPKGVSESEVGPGGWHFIPPWYKTHLMDNTVWVYSTAAQAEEQDDQPIWATTKSDSANTIGPKIGLDISVAWKINPKQGSWIYQNLGNQLDDDGYTWINTYIIKPAVNSAVNSAVLKYTVFQANNNRGLIQQEIKAYIMEELKANNLIAMDVQLRGVHFDSGLEEKVKQTQIARQEAERQKEVTKQIAELELQAIKNKNIAITEAQGKAEAIKLSAMALEQNPKLVEFEYVKALQMSAEQGVKIVPDMVLGNSSNMFYSLPNK